MDRLFDDNRLAIYRKIYVNLNRSSGIGFCVGSNADHKSKTMRIPHAQIHFKQGRGRPPGPGGR
jgi:hypothetical protein